MNVFMNYKMLEYDKIDISEGIDINKTNKLKECMFCHYWYFLDKNFGHGPYFCDGCCNIMQKFNFKNITIAHVKKSVCRIYFMYMSKREAKKLRNNSNLINKKVFDKKFLFIFFHYIKMDNTTYYQINREKNINKAKDYYENDKERLRQQARDKYRNLCEEDKKKKTEYGKNRYHNMSEEKKQKLKEYQKRKYQEAKMSKLNNK